MEFDPKQIEAINACCDLSKRIVAVTGEAGTGKTKILEVVHSKLKEAGYNVQVCAPTGKSAKRVQEVTGIPALTHHRLLEYTHPGDPDPKTGKPVGVSYPRRGRIGSSDRGPLECDVVLADEYMMFNTEMHRNMLDALKAGAAIRMVGDANQLPPIEENGSSKGTAPFVDILNRFNGIRLETIHRQGEGSTIVTNGHRILKGMFPVRSDEFGIHPTDFRDEGRPSTRPVEVLKKLVMDYNEQGITYATLENQIIAPTNIRWTGTFALNQMLQSMLMPDDRALCALRRPEWIRKKFKIDHIDVGVGDKIVWTVNNYDLNIFNGETGIVEHVSEYEEITINFGDRTVLVPPQLEYKNIHTGKEGTYDPRTSIDLAYALTTHKCQGSEYRRIIYVMDKAVTAILNRHNFYTAVTRAREHVDVVSDNRSLSMAVTKKEAMF